MKKFLFSLTLLTAVLLPSRMSADDQPALERDWTVYLVQHAHTDIGYTKPQFEIMSEHLRYIDYAIDYCDQTKDYPQECRFKWTCETTWAVSEYIKIRPKHQVDRLMDCIKRGQIEVAAMYFNMAETADDNSLRYFLQPIKDLKDRGIPIQTAMQNDVNGFAWCFPEWLSDLGVKYFSMGINVHKSLLPFDDPTIFRWESPCGKSLVGFEGLIYITGNWWGVHTGDANRLEENLFPFLAKLEANGYPFNAIAIQYSGYDTDNSPPSCKSSDFVKSWNENHNNPKLRTALAHEFLEYAVESNPESIKSYRAAWPDWWTDGFGSAAKETSIARKTHSDILSVQGFMSMALAKNLEVPSFVNSEIESVNKDLLFWDEHTFGAAESIGDPGVWNSQIQWDGKSSYAWTAQRSAKMLYETAAGLFQSEMHRDTVPTITLFNTLAWERDAFTTLYLDYDIIPWNSKFSIVDEDGTPIAVQPLNCRNEGRYYKLYAKNVPALGYKTYRVVVEDPAPQAVNITRTATNVMENEYYRIQIDPARGTISSLYDKKADREMVDGGAEWGFGALLYETLDDRWPLSRSNAVGLHRSTTRDVTVSEVISEPLCDKVIIKAKGDGITEHGLWAEFKLYRDLPRIEMLYCCRRLDETHPSSLYVALPFAGDDKTSVVFDVQGGSVDPHVNQLQGSSTAWNTIQNYIAIRPDSDYQIVLGSEEVPLYMIGALLDGPFKKFNDYKKPHIYSWIMNNYWVTNFLASQSGEFTWTYTITSMDSNSDADALRTSIGDRTPLYGRGLPKSVKDDKPMHWSAMTVNGDGLVTIAMSPAKRKGYVIMQIRETTGNPQSLQILGPNGKARKFRIVNAIEEPMSRKCKSKVLEPYTNSFVMVKAR